VQNADLTVVMGAGQIVEQGTHHELHARKGLYHYLTSQQLRS
jgi:subfamily B ATP-binding cassette protein MsbA